MPNGSAIGTALLALLICGTRAAAEGADQEHGTRHHFLVSWDDGEVELTAVGPDVQRPEGRYKFSCSSFRFEGEGKQRVITFIDAELESHERIFVAEEMSVHARGPGVKIRSPMVGSKFKSEVARQRHLARVRKGDWSGIDAGMRESAKEHRERWMHVLNRQEPYSVYP